MLSTSGPVSYPCLCQQVPAALLGRDVIGIAKTGSGKTAAFLWPMMVHIMDQPELEAGEGPIGLVCAPTRELCLQIYHEAKRFAKVSPSALVWLPWGGVWEFFCSTWSLAHSPPPACNYSRICVLDGPPKVYGLRVVSVYGGGSRWEQTKQLKEGAEIVIATPGRLIGGPMTHRTAADVTGCRGVTLRWLLCSLRSCQGKSNQFQAPQLCCAGRG